jgi:hypothetical protein
MNEADTSNDRAVMESLNSANSLQPEPASCPFYSVVPSENLAMKQLPLLKPAADQLNEPPSSESSEDVTQQDWVAEPDCTQQKLVDAEFQQLLALNEELRSANNELYEQVEHLKDDLAESEKALQWQKRRSSVTESMLNQQAQELIAAQEQIQSLFQQLDTAAQTIQRHETLIETYKAQLQISQQRLAQLERECALLQTNYNEQSQQILQSETTCRELRSRLMRQQRQTLQFKAALEKCLEPPTANEDSSEDIANHSPDTATKQTRFSRKARSLFPNVQPIRPWSAEPESAADNIAHLWGESSVRPAHNNYPTSEPSSPWNWQTQDETSQPAQSDTVSEIDDEPTASETEETVTFGESSKLDEQIDSLIQMFFASQAAASALPVTETEVTSHQSESDVPIWESWNTNGEQPETPLEQQLEVLETEVDAPITISSSVTESSTESTSAISFNLQMAKKTAEEAESDWSLTTPEDTAELSEANLTQESCDDFANDDTQSPSPVVYPQRPPKGRKSLASVELPNFRPNSQNNS